MEYTLNIKTGYMVSSDGSNVYEHRVKAEEKLGRQLKPKEVVHHIDSNRQNNELWNLMVFRTQADHTRHHNLKHMGVLVRHIDGTYSCEKSKNHYSLRQRTCQQCGMKFRSKERDAIFCSESCRHRRKSKNPFTKLQLHKAVWDKPCVKIAIELNCSDRAIGKWCAKLNVPKPPPGFWEKAQALAGVSCPLPN